MKENEPTATTSNNLLTVAELAQELRCSDMHVRNLITKGVLRAHRFTGIIRITRDDADAYINNTATRERMSVAKAA
jgi:excisionase family DNA binding protein